ncbi:TPA: ORF6N domain-containing protein [Salmonella enterica subsp. enterica serovar Kottbus]
MIAVDTLQIILHNQLPVITTELLASLYGAEINSIQQNFKRNADRFIAGKHFFKLEGNALRDFKNRLTDGQSVAKHTRTLILWTERGAARHAKMLETDQAWDVFEKLEDCYFNLKNPSEKQEPIIEGDGRTVVIRFDGQGNITFTQEVPNNAVVCTVERFRLYLEEHGWIVAHKGQLVERLMQL